MMLFYIYKWHRKYLLILPKSFSYEFHNQNKLSPALGYHHRYHKGGNVKIFHPCLVAATSNVSELLELLGRFKPDTIPAIRVAV